MHESRFAKQGLPKSKLSTTQGADAEQREAHIFTASSEFSRQQFKNKKNADVAIDRYLKIFMALR